LKICFQSCQKERQETAKVLCGVGGRYHEGKRVSFVFCKRDRQKWKKIANVMQNIQKTVAIIHCLDLTLSIIYWARLAFYNSSDFSGITSRIDFVNIFLC